MDASTATPSREADRVDRAVGLGLVAVLAILSRDLLLWEPRSALYEGVAELERFAFDTSDGNHQLGLLVCALLLWRGRGALRSGATEPGTEGLAVGLALVATLGSAWSGHTGALDLLLPAIAIWLVSVGTVFAGARGARGVMVAACVLIVTMPPPVAVVNTILHPMQMATAASVSWLLDLLSIEHVRSAEYVYTNSRLFYVVEGCAGLGILQSMMLASLVMGGLLGYDLRGHLRLMGLAVVIALAVNQLRVLTIVLLPDSELASDHAMQGLVMVVLSVVLLGLIDAWGFGGTNGGSGARVLESRTPAEERGVEEGDGAQRGLARRCLIAVGSATVFVMAGAFVPAWEAPESTSPRAADVAMELEGFRARRSLELDREYLGSVRWSDRVFRRYVEVGAEVPLEIDALVLVDHARDRTHDIASAKVARVKPGLVIHRASSLRLPKSGRVVELIEADGPEGTETLVFFRSTPERPLVALVRSVFALDQSVWHRAAPGVSVRLAMTRPLAAFPKGSAQARFIRFADAFADALSEIGLIPAEPEDMAAEAGEG